ncbi:glutathione S-transferase family protein [Sediminicoccus sp. KRV36]|uniref:glutathione S-transferase family protein n=1 Tax=Sediminicoccus sp. KRV36 TaxID=3133721 RepID=UPI00200E7EDB|nr:glutathione S-transferase family protein [Sediminicoccus rosea]UPY36082.1 glutathione S-transferase family protein [Sediminicoccus rosea]
MLTIYGVYRSRASRNIWLALEAGMPFRHVPVIQAYSLPDPLAPGAQINTRSPEFLKVNPNGRIPAMEDDGLVLAESLAINLYMAKKAGGPLAPADLREDAQMTAWSIWAMTEAEPHTIQILYNMVAKPPAERDAALAQASIEALRGPFAVLDAALAQTGFVVGGRFTVADINLAEVIRYAAPAKELFEAAPHVKAWLTACHARPAFKQMMADRDKEAA